MKRLSSLDYLRGLAAFGIMVFHYSMWSFGLFTSNDFLGRVGIYAVSIFYVLSGLTLFHVYYEKIGAPSAKGLMDFALKRVFRIFPLLWLVSIITLFYTHETYSHPELFYNFSGLFSFIHWDNTVAYGAWSIGNELTFYLFFPVFIFLSKKSRISFILFSILLFLVYLWFAFIRMDSSKTLGEYWEAYTNPLNQVFLFLGGFLMGLLADKIIIPKPASFLLIAVGLLIFTFLPVKGDSILLVTGFNRLIFTLICFVICFSFYKTDFGLPHLLDRCFGILGEISYSVYLVHPVTWNLMGIALKKFNIQLPPVAKLFAGFILSVFIAYAIYRIYERYFMRLGKKISKKFAISGNGPHDC